ncbi:MAG: hypothetical protein JWL83_2814 [Actinomycetia bacterium]|nr:hypothetical protein [Actinomycetes bacterium]
MNSTPRLVVLACAAILLSLTACSSSSPRSRASRSTTTTHAPAQASAIVLNGQGNDLDAYLAAPPFTKQVVDHHHDDAHPNSLDINGQICFDPKNPRRFIAGEDTNQDTTGHPGWGILQLSGDHVGNLSIDEVGKLVPTYQASTDNPENYGCGFLPNGNIVTTDVGNQAAGQGDGQLIVWFGPFDSFAVKYCKIDVGLTTGQGVLVRGNELFVANARADDDHASGVYRYDLSTFPTSNDAAGGCDGKDPTGAPMTTKVTSSVFIKPNQGNNVATPNAIVQAPNGHLFVSSVINGVIGEFDANGTFLRDVVKAKATEKLGAKPFSVGTPLGLGVDALGNLYYADIGIVAGPKGVGPGDATGTVRRVAFVKGKPQAPVVLDRGLAFPDGIGVWTLPAP